MKALIQCRDKNYELRYGEFCVSFSSHTASPHLGLFGPFGELFSGYWRDDAFHDKTLRLILGNELSVRERAERTIVSLCQGQEIVCVHADPVPAVALMRVAMSLWGRRLLTAECEELRLAVAKGESWNS